MVMPIMMRYHLCSRLEAGRNFYLFLPQLEDPDGAERDAGDRRVAPQLRVIFALLDPDPDTDPDPLA
jgi:hypothetical protein